MPESMPNGASAGLSFRDWLAEPETPTEVPPGHEPERPLLPQPRQSAPPPAAAERQRRQHVADAALVVPDLVRLQLDTALFGDGSPHGSAGPDDAPRSKNLTVLVGTVRVRTNRRGQTQREITDLGAVRYRYELSINEVFASATGVAYENYRFPITMPDAVLARCSDLLIEVAQALERTRTNIEASNAELRAQVERHQQALQALQERNRDRAAEGKKPLPLPNAPAQPLPDQVLEQRVIQAQHRLLTGTRIRVEVGYVELLRGTPISVDERAQLIADREAEERTRQSRRQSAPARPPRAQPDADTREAALDQATEQLMLRVTADEAAEQLMLQVTADEAADDVNGLEAAPEAGTEPPTARSPSRPRRRATETAPVAEALPDDDAPSQP